MSGADWLRRQRVAHRGLHDIKLGVPENSRLAFQRAMDAGHAIELDVRLSADGVPMVFHDHDLARLCNRAGTIGQVSAADLGRFTLLGTAETVPTLAEVLDQVEGRVPLLIELKSGIVGRSGALEQAVAGALDGYAGAFAVQSFNPRTVVWFQRERPNWLRGQIADGEGPTRERLGPVRGLALRTMLRRFWGAPHFVAYNIKHLPEALTIAARARGLPVLTWTVRSADDHDRASKHADNVIFETLS